MNKHVLAVVFAFFTIVGFGQSESNGDEPKYRFGFNFGVNYSCLKAKEILPKNADLYNGMGAKLGLLMDYTISKDFLFSPKIEMAFNNSGVETTNADDSKSNYKVFPVSLDFMTHFVYRRGEAKAVPYMLVGPNLRLAVEKNSTPSSTFKTNPDLAIDFGFGLENRLKHFRFAPEIRYSMGLLNVNANPALRALNYHNFSLVLNFK